MSKISKILVANRGEIAVRVISTARKMGYPTVAIYSDADTGAPHVLAADEAVCLGNPVVSESYLDMDKVIDAAKATGADAIHPGYGFLSENAGFAQACEENDIVFIGPPASAIDLMGSKRQSKIAMLEAMVPCIPGYEGGAQDDESLAKEARKIGFPLMIKASAGGGGRGMRLVHEESELLEQISTARSEAEKAFGNGELILEKALLSSRHVEIQVFADDHDNAVYLGERDCSVQRRHQKVVEEAPCPVLDETTRKAMGEAAVNAARACDYRGAGTVEFLLDEDNSFYFLEMNTRLQVEHPVTELVTGTDLVEWQILVASGQPLPLQQDEIRINGHAMEVRLYAEDAHKDFLPQTGTVHFWKTSDHPGIRTDHCLASGNDITPFYDSMVAKVIAHGRDREETIRKLARGLEDTSLLGVTTNKPYLLEVLGNEVFQGGVFNTKFVEEHLDSSEDRKPADAQLLLAGALMILTSDNNQLDTPFLGWRNSLAVGTTLQLSVGDENILFHVESMQKDGEKVLFSCQYGEQPASNITILSARDNQCIYLANGIRRKALFTRYQNELYIDGGTFVLNAINKTHSVAASAEAAGSGILKAPMDGALIKLAAREGQSVTRGQTLAIIEAMKMEHQVKADMDGTIASVSGKEGDQVSANQVLVTLDAGE